MNPLIKIETRNVDGSVKNTVNARELHAFLEVKRQFADWIKDNLEIFTQGVDFIIFHEKVKNSEGRPRIEYALTIECGKHIAMMSRTEKGRQARDYFIECERRAKDPIALLSDPAALRGLLGNYAEKVIELENTIQEQKPKVDGFERIANADGGLNMTNAAKNLEIRPKDFFDFLVLNKWIYRRIGGKNFVAYQDKIQSGYLTHKVYSITLDDGAERINEQVIVTPKGLAKLSLLIPETIRQAA